MKTRAMLVIRREQIDLLNADMAKRFINNAAKRLSSLFPKVVPSEGPKQVAWVEEGIGRAELHGFRTEIEMNAYLDARAAFVVDFDAPGGNCSWAQSLFAMAGVPSGDKAAVLRHKVKEAGSR